MILRTFTRGFLRHNRLKRPDPVDIAVCIDIECTCDSPIQIQPMELIEIACLKLDLPNASTVRPSDDEPTSRVDECPIFHSFVKPVINPELTLFCQELTGVFQSMVDKADPVDRVTDKLLAWLQREKLINDNHERTCNFAFASCGNFDLNLLAPVIKRCKFNNDPEWPIYFQEWINVKKTFVNHKGEWPKGLYHMLELVGLEPTGRLHSAQDDCKNLARIVECLHGDGCKFHVTNRIQRPRVDKNDSNSNANNKT